MKIRIIVVLHLVVLQIGISQTHYTDFELAKQEATDQNKMILMVFSGSDWCKPCIQLKTEIVTSDTFVKFQNDYLVYLEVDFPYHKSNQLSKVQTKHNEDLAERFNKDGTFPKVVLLDPAGQRMGQIIYKKGMKPDQFIDQIRKQVQ